MRFIYYSLYRLYTRIPIAGNNVNVYIAGVMALLVTAPFLAVYNVCHDAHDESLQYGLLTLLIPYGVAYKTLYDHYEKKGDKIVAGINKLNDTQKNIAVILSWLVMGFIVYLWIFDGAYEIYAYFSGGGE
ncbi:hypothetical protein [Segatella maculosa]|uniref:hypothetical protein n=1 Tax=Segatella maculosa TaxID=439703 RepID=UPI0028D6AAD3|nr:hypothetical protein [Segatella maculosa]